jgi:hypothetical protein
MLSKSKKRVFDNFYLQKTKKIPGVLARDLKNVFRVVYSVAELLCSITM